MVEQKTLESIADYYKNKRSDLSQEIDDLKSTLENHNLLSKSSIIASLFEKTIEKALKERSPAEELKKANDRLQVVPSRLSKKNFLLASFIIFALIVIIVALQASSITITNSALQYTTGFIMGASPLYIKKFSSKSSLYFSLLIGLAAMGYGYQQATTDLTPSLIVYAIGMAIYVITALKQASKEI